MSTPTAAAQALAHAIGMLADLADNAATKDGFAALDDALTQVWDSLATLDYITAAHAYGAVKAQAGDKVGSTNARDYLTRALHLSNREASVRIKRGEVLLGRTKNPDDMNDRRRAVALFRAGKVGLEHFDAINTRINKIPADAEMNVEKFRLEAYEQAADRTVEDFRQWLEDSLDKEAAKMPDRLKIAHTRRKRGLRFGRQDRYGGVTITMYTPADSAVLLKQRLDKWVDTLESADRQASKDKGCDIKRSTDQYYHDAMTALCAESLRRFDAKRADKLAGTASLVISVVADELPSTVEEAQNHDGSRKFHTSTGLWLYPEQVLGLLGDKYDWVVAHDSITGFPLALGRARRSATIGQRIALFAHQGVCAAPGCNRSLSLCQAHHIDAWKDGGGTDLENLTLLCTFHHGLNDDDGTSSRRGRVERDPETMRTYTQFRGTRRSNNSVGHTRSAGRKIQDKHE